MTEPWVRFEDEDLLVVAKPAGVNTHRADTYAQDGMHEWVQRQRPEVKLAILHRLDKATSGLLLFGKTTAANRSLAAQFEARTVAKRYELLVPRDPRRPAELRADQPIGRAAASTDFTRQARGPGFERFAARPHTGRTHQVRIHAAALGMPIVGDAEHGGGDAARLFLHAAGLRVGHPRAAGHGEDAGRMIELDAPRPGSFDQVLDGVSPIGPAVAARAALEAREQLFDPEQTNAYLWIDRHHDGFARVRVERLGDVAFVCNYDDSSAGVPDAWLEVWRDTAAVAAVFEQRRPRGGGGGPARLVSGAHPSRFTVRELGCQYLIDLEASATSTGLFLDQRETRRRLLAADRRGQTVLNVFAHTGSLSVAAALAGAETLTLDLSPRYLDWARDNLRANALDPADHDFIYGDALEWMDRLAKKGRSFDVVLVDPPSTSTSGGRGSKRWVAERDLHTLVARGARLAAPGGTVFVSTNLHRLSWPRFVDHLDRGLATARRTGAIETQTVPIDHRSGPGDPPYLKAAWIHLDDPTG